MLINRIGEALGVVELGILLANSAFLALSARNVYRKRRGAILQLRRSDIWHISLLWSWAGIVYLLL